MSTTVHYSEGRLVDPAGNHVDLELTDVGIVGVTSTQTISGDKTFTGAVTVAGVVTHDGTEAGFFGAAPVAQPAALTAPEAGALDTGDAGSDTVIDNIRTRLGEIEDALQALGLLA